MHQIAHRRTRRVASIPFLFLLTLLQPTAAFEPSRRRESELA